jgi:hypothetical protein
MLSQPDQIEAGVGDRLGLVAHDRVPAALARLRLPSGGAAGVCARRPGLRRRPVNVLLDTPIWLWWLLGSERLSAAEVRALDRSA